jgi:hypothetical protein
VPLLGTETGDDFDGVDEIAEENGQVGVLALRRGIGRGLQGVGRSAPIAESR